MGDRELPKTTPKYNNIFTKLKQMNFDDSIAFWANVECPEALQTNTKKHGAPKYAKSITNFQNAADKDKCARSAARSWCTSVEGQLGTTMPQVPVAN